MGNSGSSDDFDAQAPTGADVAAGVAATEMLANGAMATGARLGSSSAVAAGDSIGNYRVIGSIGRGGMGEVFEGEDTDLHRRIAIKVLQAELGDGNAEPGNARLLREARAMARLAHPNVITVHDVGTVADQVFVAMELVEGGTLRDWLGRAPRAWQEIVTIFVAAGRGLAAAHAAGLVHRDFKPDNVLVGSDGRVKVTDFGLVSTGGGTPAYTAPEQHRGQPTDGRADQFAFCFALHEALHGEAPFAGASYPELAANVAAGRRRKSQVMLPAHLERALARGLRPDKEQRFASMEALLGEIDCADRGGGAVMVAALAAAVVTLVAGVWLGQAHPSPCQQAGSALAGVWDAERKQAVEHAFLATGRAHAARSFATVSGLLDDYASAWVDMREYTCEVTRADRGRSDAALDLGMACLDRRLATLASLTEAFAAAPSGELVDGAVDDALALPPLTECADVEPQP